MTIADFNNRFKNHINISAKNYLANNAEEALVEVFLNSNTYCKQHIDHEMFSIETLSMRGINTGVHEFVKSNWLILIEYLV